MKLNTHKIAMYGTGALVILATLYFVGAAKAEPDLGVDPATLAPKTTGFGSGGLGGWLKSLLGQGTTTSIGGGANALPSGLPDPTTNPAGQFGIQIDGIDTGAGAPGTDSTTDYVQQFKQSLTQMLNGPNTTAGTMAAGALNYAPDGAGGFTYTPDAQQTPGGMAYLPDSIQPVPAGQNTFTVQINDADNTWPDGTPMVSKAATGQLIYTGPTGYVDITGEQTYQQQYGGGSPNSTILDRLPEGTGGPSNAIAYVPNTGAPVYQSTPNGLELVAPGTQLPGPDGTLTGFLGYGLQSLPEGTPLTGLGTDPNAQTAPPGSMVITPLANSNSPDNWWGFQGHNPNNPYDTN